VLLVDGTRLSEALGIAESTVFKYRQKGLIHYAQGNFGMYDVEACRDALLKAGKSVLNSDGVRVDILTSLENEEAENESDTATTHTLNDVSQVTEMQKIIELAATLSDDALARNILQLAANKMIEWFE
jgi:hypothetical protein